MTAARTASQQTMVTAGLTQPRSANNVREGSNIQSCSDMFITFMLAIVSNFRLIPKIY